MRFDARSSRQLGSRDDRHGKKRYELPGEVTIKMRTVFRIVVAGVLTATAFAGSASANTAATGAELAGTSRYQAGYRATHDAFRSVHASWIVPSISCPGESSRGYGGEAWLGVGMGPSNPRSEQVVTRAFCTGTQASYVAYLEVGGAQATGSAGGTLLPNPGDRISATVTYLGVFPDVVGGHSYHVSRYRFSITDLTQHKSATIVDRNDCLARSCDRSTAEVTAGIPFAGYSALADYRKVTFSNTRITDTRRHHGSFSKNKHWNTARLVQSDSSTHDIAASPSRLTHHGTQFSDNWRAY